MERDQPDSDPSKRGEVRVLVVDDHAGARDLLGELIAGIDGFVLVGEAASGQEALESAAALHPGLVIMDGRMPGIDGLEATRLLKARHPEIVVLLTSADELPAHVVAASGAASFIHKHQLSRGRVRAVWEAAAT